MTIRDILENLLDPNDDSLQYDPPELLDKATKQLLDLLESKVILGWYKYPSKALEGDIDYEIAQAINADRTRARVALRELGSGNE